MFSPELKAQLANLQSFIVATGFMLGQPSVMVFDIETIPDMESIRFEYGISDDSSMSDADLAQAAFDAQQEKSGTTFLPHIMHRVVAISCLLRQNEDKVYIGSLGKPDSQEKELISEFYRLIREYTPNLVSWNGSAFDLPVLNYRAMLYGIDAGRFWQNQRGFTVKVSLEGRTILVFSMDIGFIRMRRKTSPFTAEISGEDCEAVLKTFNFSQAYFAAQYIAE
ncbi:3'-5' exonuclease [Eikenella corrodens]|uniref:3'-5' exonuclease n=1 Tax=Eikenella corrodens TaxID=539 RepID=UPI0014308B89|nr:3'-5' exonuclease [Eikenella corrodens]